MFFWDFIGIRFYWKAANISGRLLISSPIWRQLRIYVSLSEQQNIVCVNRVVGCNSGLIVHLNSPIMK